MDKVGEIRFHGQHIDIYGDLDKPLFLAVDVARMIDYSVGHTAHMLECVDPDEKVLISIRNNNVSDRTNTASARGNATLKWFLTEDGLYEVLFQSRKPIAKRFKAAVKQVLKDLRKEKGLGIDEWFDDLSGLTKEEWDDSLAALREDLGK